MGFNLDQFDPEHARQLREALDSPTGQLPLFATAADLLSVVRPNPGDVRRHRASGVVEDDSMLWKRKLKESTDGSLRSSMAAEGMRKPPRVTASTGTVKDGHHRLAVASADTPDRLIPVDWEKDENAPVGGGWEMQRISGKREARTGYQKDLWDLLSGPVRLEP